MRSTLDEQKKRTISLYEKKKTEENELNRKLSPNPVKKEKLKS